MLRVRSGLAGPAAGPVFLLTLATLARAQDPQLEFARTVAEAFAEGRLDEVAARLRAEPDRTAFLVRDALRAAVRSGDVRVAEMARAVTIGLPPSDRQRRLRAEVEAWFARDRQQIALAAEFEERIATAQRALAGGRPAAAVQAARSAVAAAVAVGSRYLEGRARSLLGVALRAAGSFDEALQALEAAVAAGADLGAELELQGDRRELAATYEARAEARNLAGDYEGSLADRLRACECWRRLGDSDQHGRALVLLGGAFSELARDADAETVLQQALAIFPDPSAARGRVLAAIGLCRLDRGDGAGAEPLLEQARRLARDHGDGYGEGEACRLLARLALEAGRPEASLPLLDRALELPGGRLQRALAWTARGDAHAALGRQEAAAEDYRQALQAGGDLLDGAWRARVGLGRLLEDRDPQAALERYLQAVDDLERLREMVRLPVLRVRALAERRVPYLRAARLAVRAGEVEQAFELLERLQARTLWEVRAAGGREPVAADVLRPIEVRLAACERELEAAPVARRPALLARRRALQAEHERAALSWALAQPRRGVLAGRRPVSLQAVQRALAPGEVLLFFGAGEESTLCLVLRRQRATGIELPLAFARLAAAVGELLQPVEDLQQGRVDLGNLRFPVRAARQLYDELLAPLPLGRPSRLFVVADGPLRRLPFSLLVSTFEPRPVRPGIPYAQYHGCRFLIEDCELVRLPAASLLAAGDRPASGTGAAVVGFGLPGAAAEAAAVAAAWGVTVLPPTEAALRQAASEAALVHLAAHAGFEPLRAGFSRLALSATGDQDGLLHAYEIARWSLPGPVVVLSGCETAGRAGAGDGLLGLTRSFLEAGARAVVATWWRVEDEASARLMVDFHAALRAGDDAARALAAAQRRMLVQGRAQGLAEAHPWFWAGYSVHGKP